MKTKPLLTTIAAVFLVRCGESTGTSIWKASTDGDIGTVELFITLGTDVNLKDKHHEKTPLHYSTIGGSNEIVKLLIANGADINAKGKDGITPLDMAKRHLEIANLLRKHGGKTRT